METGRQRRNQSRVTCVTSKSPPCDSASGWRRPLGSLFISTPLVGSGVISGHGAPNSALQA